MSDMRTVIRRLVELGRTDLAQVAASCEAEIDRLRAELAEARRLLDESRKQEPDEWRCVSPGGTTTRRLQRPAMEEHKAQGWTCKPLYAATVPAQPAVKVGDSFFESWYSLYNPEGKSTKQTMREAYEAGLVDHEGRIDGQPAVPDDVAKDAIPAGWVFFSADASIQANDTRRPLTAMIRRDVDGLRWWLSLTDEEKERTPLYSTGAGMTLKNALDNAVAAILSATDTEGRKDE